MANSKISALPSATTPLAGTETLPVVQSSTTKQVSVANLTAGRAVSAASLALTTSPLPATSGGTGTATAFTSGSVIFASASGVYSQDNTNFFWDDANNRLGLGTSTPATGFHLFNTTARPFTAGNFSATWSFGQTGANFAFRENSSVSDFVSIDGNNGNTTIGVGNLIIGTSGKGIDFSATPGTGTSELFADYEEGDFTPTIAGSGTSGTGTYTTQVGKYTKVGRTVSFEVTLTWTNLTGATGILVMNGLPFTSANVAGLATPVTTIADSVALAAGYYMQNFIFANSTQVAIRQFPSGNGTAAAVGLVTSGTIYLSGTYIV